MADNRTISQLEAEGYPWIGCECCKGTVWVPFKMIRVKLPMLSAQGAETATSPSRHVPQLGKVRRISSIPRSET